jgi:hypothetical protein
VGALVAVGEELLFTRADQQAHIVLAGVQERSRLSDGNVPNPGDRARPDPGVLASERLERDPRLARDEGAADQHHELGEVPTRDVVVLRGVDREVLAPLWLLFGRAAVRGKDAELG